MHLTDVDLIQGCIRNEATCQKEVFDRYASRLLGVCYRYARSTADAEDILQEAFIKIFDKIGQFKHEGSFEGWMRRIVVNTALKKYSLIRYSKETIGTDGLEFPVSDVDETVHASLSEKEILQLVNRLPDGYRLIFNLNVIEGYQHNEIAEMLGIQASTSRSQLVKARLMLQKQILELEQKKLNVID